VENIERTSDMQRFVQPMKGIVSPAAAAGPLKDIQAELEKALAPEIRSRVVDIKTRKEGLVVSLREVGFYQSGASTMRASSVGSIDRLAEVLASPSENMRIEGHTDNVPIHNPHFPSNWELSTSRHRTREGFYSRYNFAPSRLSAAGCAEFHPVADNNATDGRVRNRRVDIVILNLTSSGLMPPRLSWPQVTSSSPVSAPKTASSPNNLLALNRLAPLCDGFP
jgi:chemotaxis protein MotB